MCVCREVKRQQPCQRPDTGAVLVDAAPQRRPHRGGTQTHSLTRLLSQLGCRAPRRCVRVYAAGVKGSQGLGLDASAVWVTLDAR